MLQDIFSAVPWLKVFLAWTLAALVVFLVLTVPAYYLVLPLTQRLRSEISRYLMAVRERHAKQRAERSEADRALLAQYAEDHLLRHLDTMRSKFWARTKAAIIHPAQEIQTRLADVTGKMEGFTKSLPQLHERLQTVIDTLPKDFNLTVSEPNLSQSTGTLRVAWMALVGSSLLLLALITVNTGMLSQIVRDLGFIPPTFKFFNIPLFYILALLITFVEAGLGAIHGILSDTEMSDQQVRIHVGPMLASAGSVGVACVEGFFYSRIMPSRTETVTLPLIGYTVPQTDIFFMWGFLLVMTLFGLGLIIYRMAARVLRGTALASARKQLRIVTAQTVRLTEALRDTERVATAARAAASQGNQDTPTTPPFAADAVERLLKELRVLVKTPPEWVSVLPQPLSASGVLHLARHSLLWFGVAISATVISIATAITSYGRLATDTGAAVMLASAQTALVVTVGFLLGWGETVVQGHDWQKVTAPSWARLIAIALAGAFTLAYALLGFSAYTTGIVLLWMGNFLVCLVVVAACYQLMPLASLGEIWVRRLIDRFVGACERTYRLFVGLALLCATILDQIVGMFAGPIVIFKSRGANTSTELSKHVDQVK
jgi:hypothetical protein